MRASPQRGRRMLVAVLAVALVLVAGLFTWRAWRAGARYEQSELLAGGNEPPAPRVSPDSEALERSALEAASSYAGEHGSQALIVSRHDHIVFEHYWRGTNFDTVADAQAFTRLLHALATGVAASHRLIGWPDEPVGTFISEWQGDARGAITVRNLLQSASGLAGPAALPPDTPLVPALLGLRLSAPPGTRRSDQPADPQLLALLLERASKERFAAYASRVLWRRIGAADAWLWLDQPGGSARADCCLRAHQGDWIRVAELLLRDGNYRGSELMRPGWVTLMRSPSKADPDFGAFLRVATSSAGRAAAYALPDVFLVAGAGGNRMWLVPSLQIAILCTGDPRGRDAQWDDTRVPNLIIRGARDFLPPAARPGGDVSAIVPGH